MKKYLILIVAVVVLSGCGKEEKSVTEISNEIALQESEQESMQESVMKTYTMDEIEKHATREDCWTVMDGQVANVSSFFGVHPGGDDNLEKACGVDATKMFQSVKKHDPKGYEKLQELVIGAMME